MTKATAISDAVRLAVYERDHGRCVVCGVAGIPNSHIIRRSQGGMGIIENIVCHCISCHRAYDSYEPATVAKTMDYIKSLYPDWTRERVTFSKWTK